MIWKIRGGQVDLAGPVMMGILNVTPDSFSDDGLVDVDVAAGHALRMAADGAGIIDVGGESSRPGAVGVSEAEELRRVLPAVERLAREDGIVISVDTVKPAVAEAVLAAGAHIINDISGLRDPAMAAVVAKYGAGVVIMHMQGTPATMQDNPYYDDVVGEVTAYFRGQIEAAHKAGIADECIVLDPGIGFGKTLENNLKLLAAVRQLRKEFPQPLLIGASRKGFLKQLTDRTVAQERVYGTAAVTALVVADGANIIRVHDVAANHDAAVVAWAIAQAR